MTASLGNARLAQSQSGHSWVPEDPLGAFLLSFADPGKSSPPFHFLKHQTPCHEME